MGALVVCAVVVVACSIDPPPDDYELSPTTAECNAPAHLVVYPDGSRWCIVGWPTTPDAGARG